ncbi:hypothetical protein MMC29_006027 [Sticta canariensis]|nr:hypothetical protein [Sticta canariensis]
MKFAFLRLPDPSPTHTEALTQHTADYVLLVSSSTRNITPFVYIFRFFGPILLTFYLLIPPTTSKLVFYFRYPLFAFVIYLAAQTLWECRSDGPAAGYLIGLTSAWSTLWGATLVIFRDARSEFRRIERRNRSRAHDQGGAENGSEVNFASVDSGGEKQELRRRNDKQGIVDSTPITHSSQQANLQQKSPLNNPSADDPAYYVWQSLPPTFLHRLGWVLDLVSNFRGIGWNYQIPTIPPPPSYVLATLRPPFPHSPLPPANPPSRASFVRSTLITIPFLYLICDACKYLAMHDPYFFSLSAPPSSSPYPFPNFTRRAISVVATCAALFTLFYASRAVACILGPGILGIHADPLRYPACFGSPTHIATKGIAGMWGNSWHQMFRFAFDSAGDFLAKPLGAGWERKTAKGSILRLFTAFFLSGLLHAAGSYTTLPRSYPRNAFLFFAIQPIGILAQRLASSYLRQVGWRDRLPVWLKRAGNAVVVFAWCCATGPLIADDFAAAKVWLFEPLPYSLWRGEWVWYNVLGKWYDGDGTARWWERGYAM